MHIYIHIYMYIYINGFIYIHIYHNSITTNRPKACRYLFSEVMSRSRVYVNMYIYIYVYAYIYIYMNIYIYIYMYVYIHIYMYIYICIYMHIYISWLNHCKVPKSLLLYVFWCDVIYIHIIIHEKRPVCLFQFLRFTLTNSNKTKRRVFVRM